MNIHSLLSRSAIGIKIVLLALLMVGSVCDAASGFRAYKATGVYQYFDASPQYQKINFPSSKSWSVGYDGRLSRWTPPAGMVSIAAHVWLIQGTNRPTPSETAILVIKILKNGLQLPESEVGAGLCGQSTYFNTVANQVTAECVIPGFVDQANGTDYYELHLFTNTPDTVIDPNAGHTYFNGISVQ